ncbi:MAG: hypothetical protein DMG76_30370 [Acidobacteria bacterium]|nr:MAG: hypothetical protein DMG76_30370 [Acidobacteriota bacterium]
MKRPVLSTLVVTLLICLSGYAALFVAPDERTMHAAQRIFYFHVPSWIAMFVAFLIAVIGNIAYLTTRSPKWDWLGVAGAEVGVACCTIGLITGPLWGKPAWGIWWTWDPRLTTTFILWLLYISYLLLRGMIEDSDRCARMSAVFWGFCVYGRPIGLYVESFMADSASRSCLLRRPQGRSRSEDGESVAFVCDCGTGSRHRSPS